MVPLGKMLLLAFLTVLFLGFSQGARPYKVTAILEKPYMMIKNSTRGGRGNELYEGFIPDLMREIGRLADFEYEFHLVKDNKYGQRMSNGQWNGMVGELVRGEADIAATPLTRNPQRETVIDYAYPFMPATLTALMREDIEISTIDELGNSTDVVYGTVNQGSIENAFRSATKAPYKKMWAKMASMKTSPFVHDVAEGLERVRNEAYALIVETPTGEYLSNHWPCDLKTVGRFTTDGYARSWAFGMPENSPLTDDINSAMLNVQEDLTIARLYRKWWYDACDSGSEASMYSVGVLVVSVISAHLLK